MSHFAFIVSLNFITIKFKIKFEGETWHRMEGLPLPFHLMWPSHPLKICLLPRVEEPFCPVSAQIYIEQSLCHLDSRNFSQWSRPLRLSSQDHKWIEILTIYCHSGSGTWEPSRSGRGDSHSLRTKAFSSLPKPSLHIICMSPPQIMCTLTPEPSCQTLCVSGLGLPEKDIVGDFA